LDKRPEGGEHGRVLKLPLIFLAMFLASCGAATFNDYDSARLSDQQVALLKARIARVERISKEDGTLLYSYDEDGPVGQFRLVPGIYVILYGDPWSKQRFKQTHIVSMIAGHTYYCRWEYQRRARRENLWIKDDTTGQVVAGE